MFLYAECYIIEEDEVALLWLFSFLCVCRRNLSKIHSYMQNS